MKILHNAYNSYNLEQELKENNQIQAIELDIVLLNNNIRIGHNDLFFTKIFYPKIDYYLYLARKYNKIIALEIKTRNKKVFCQLRKLILNNNDLEYIILKPAGNDRIKIDLALSLYASCRDESAIWLYKELDLEYLEPVKKKLFWFI